VEDTKRWTAGYLTILYGLVLGRSAGLACVALLPPAAAASWSTGSVSLARSCRCVGGVHENTQTQTGGTVCTAL
jgi:hypothetical protein